jgi:transposase-like protein
MKTNRRKLIELMIKYQLSLKTVSDMLKVSYPTVKVWRSRSGRDISDKSLQLLTFILGERNV